ncbi:MAG: hypothetical protein HYV53_02895 [Parcubacteria group bacterium]|nr:hypothetical protein [Parcubacteria group bacterium]
MKKKLLLASFIIVALSLVFISGVKGKTSSANGDALYFRGKVYLVAINSGAAELYKIDNTKITKTATINAIAGDAGCQDFIDAVLTIDSNGLYIVLTDGKYIYKYDVNDPYNPVLFKKSNDNSNDKYLGLGKMYNQIFSVSNHGLRIWSDNMEIYYTANINNPLPHNIKFSQQGSFVFNINNGKLEIYDAFSQKLLSAINLAARDSHERNIYNDQTDSSIYLVDDRAVKQVDFSGNIIKSFKHTSSQGYDIAYVPGDDHLYFSDGIGIVKLNKSDLKPLSWIYTEEFSGPSGLAAGLKVVSDNYGEKIFVFDNYNIIILDQAYNKIGAIAIDNNNQFCLARESLSLILDKPAALAGEAVALSGRGFSPEEILSIYLSDKKIDSTKADNRGRFFKTITVPRFNPNILEFKPGKTDIKILGENSGRTYSVNFQIEGMVEAGFSLSVNKNRALAGEEVALSGRGFNPNEYVIIYVADKKVALARTDDNGGFSAVITMPEVKPGRTEIRVSGENFGSKNYSIDFTIE